MQPPTGTVTLVFTDIQGSTRLWERLGDAFETSLRRHDAVLRAAIEAHAGYEVKTEGDAFMVAFVDPANALAFCLDVQLRLQDEEWAAALLAQDEAAVVGPKEDGGPLRGVRVRMGAHSGEPSCRLDPLTGRMDYFGPVVNRAARVAHAAHGGQVLVSESTWRAGWGKDAPSAFAPICHDLGEHSLAGLDEPERLREVLPARLVGRRFPPPRTRSPKRGNVRPRTGSFLGRADELAAVDRLFSEGRRLVTLLGPGGTGKTTLASRFAETRGRIFPGGAWIAELADAHDKDALCAAVAAVLEVPLAGEDPVQRLGGALKGRGRVLILLDNLEQLLDAAAETLAVWLREAPEARFLVTSRSPLRVGGEQLLPIDPLAAPAEAETDPERLALVPGVALFVERAREQKPTFQLDERNAADVAAIVRELDGLPLAIELAAARVRMLPPHTIRQRLSRRFDLLRGARRDVSGRQATLRGAFDWSWELLEPWERLALAQCSVFAGSFSLQAIEATLDLGDEEGAPWPEEAVEALVDHSLVRLAGEDENGPRFSLLVSVQAYAAQRLGAEDREAAEQRHGEYFALLGDEDALEALDGQDGVEQRRGLQRELANIEVAAERAIGRGDAAVAAATAQAAAAFRLRAGPFAQGLSLAERAAALDGVTPGDRARLLRAMSRLAWGQRTPDERHELLQRALADAESADDALLQCHVLCDQAGLLRSLRRVDDATSRLVEAETRLAEHGGDSASKAAMRGRIELLRGNLAFASGDYPEAQNLFKKASDRLRRGGGQVELATALGNLATAQVLRGKLDAARASYKESLALLRTLGERGLEVRYLAGLAGLEHQAGAHQRAAELLTETLQQARELGDQRAQSAALTNLASVNWQLGRLADAREQFERAAMQSREVGDQTTEILAIGNLGEMALEAGDDDAAERLDEAVQGCKRLSFTLGEASYRAALGEARARSGDVPAGLEALDDACAALVELDEPVELGKALCRRAIVRLAAGDPTGAKGDRSDAGALAARAGAGPESEIGRQLARVDAAFGELPLS